MRFRPSLLATLLLLAAASPASALSISQLPAAGGGCVDNLGRYGCPDGRGLEDTQAAVVSPDGRHVYVAGGLSSNGFVTGFARDAKTGALKQIAGEGGCVSASTAPDCARGRAVSFLEDVTISPDGRTLYTVSGGGSDQALGLTVFRRDPQTGELKELQCLTPYEDLDGCTQAPLQGPSAVKITPDGRFAVIGGEALTTFPLAQDGTVAGPGTCVLVLGGDSGEKLCTGAPRTSQLQALERVEIAPDGKRIYGIGTGHVEAFDLDPATGAVKVRGCTGRSPGKPACRKARATDGLNDMALAPDGKGLYTAGAAFIPTDDIGLEGITINSTIGAYKASTLAQLPGRQGCALFATQKRGGSTLGCAKAPASRGSGFLDASAVAVTPDGSHVIAGFHSTQSVVLLKRNRTTQALTPVPGRGGCVVDRGYGTAVPGCGVGRGFTLVYDIVVTPDGRNAYVISHGGIVGMRLR